MKGDLKDPFILNQICRILVKRYNLDNYDHILIKNVNKYSKIKPNIYINGKGINLAIVINSIVDLLNIMNIFFLTNTRMV